MTRFEPFGTSTFGAVLSRGLARFDELLRLESPALVEDLVVSLSMQELRCLAIERVWRERSVRAMEDAKERPEAWEEFLAWQKADPADER